MQQYAKHAHSTLGSLTTSAKGIACNQLGLLTDPVMAALSNLWHEIRVVRVSQASELQFRSLSGMKNVKVHLGCGSDIKEGWLNIDLLDAPRPAGHSQAAASTILINYDLRRGLPLEDECSAFIYSSHFFEHLSFRDGVRLMHACYHALQPGGTFRMAMPNFKEAFRAYVHDDTAYFALIPDASLGATRHAHDVSLVDYINYSVYQFGEHKCIYDEDKLLLVLRRLGFKSVVRSSYQESVDSHNPLRQQYSFYIEATK